MSLPFLFISNQLFKKKKIQRLWQVKKNHSADRRIPRSEKVWVVLFDLPQSLDRVPSDEG